MKIIAIALLLVTVVATAASSPPSPTAPPKHDPGIVPPEGTLQGGDTIETAVVIPSIPYSTTGTTAGYNDDYDEACPYTGSTSPDVVYAWTPPVSGHLEIHTCESGYDTKIYVYENAWTPGAPLACNDDSPDCTGLPYRSWIHVMPVTGGSTYYIVIDGYGGDFGEYILNIDEIVGPVPCDVLCPSGAFDENEPDCYDGYVDETNTGCGWPYVFQYPGLNTFICGTSGNFDDNTIRDMDWFEVTLAEPKMVNWCICADYPSRLWILDGRQGCSGMYTMVTVAGTPGFWACATLELDPGTYWFLASTDGWLGIPCGSEYVAILFEEGYSQTEQVSWGVVKAMYR